MCKLLLIKLLAVACTLNKVTSNLYVNVSESAKLLMDKFSSTGNIHMKPPSKGKLVMASS